jgi:hypothetical protein
MKNEVKKGITLFDHLKQITDIQSPNYWDSLSESDRKAWSNYMVIRFLSMERGWIDTISMIQFYIEELPPKQLYLTLIDALPKGRKFLKYMKAKGADKYEKWLVDLFAKHYEVSNLEVETYLRILYSSKEGKKQIIDICELYGTDPKEIKKLKIKV